MFNSYNHNTTPYNAQTIEGFNLLPNDLVTFDGFVFGESTNGICVTDLKEDNAANRQLVTGNSIRRNGQFIAGDYFRSKTIIVEGYINKPSQEALDNFIDEFKKSLRKQTANLDITRREDSTSRRRYKATLINYDTIFNKKEPNYITFTPFTCVFECLDPFGYGIDYDFTSSVIQVGLQNFTTSNNGSAPSNPIIYLSFTEADNVTSVKVTNNATGESIEYSGAVSSGSLIEFNSEELVTRINGISSDFSGAFMTLEPGSNLISVEIIGDSFEASTTVKWKKAYL